MRNQSVKQVPDSPDVEGIPVEVREEILRAVASINFGSVEVVVHGAKVVQIESREKRRIVNIKSVD
jgi:hypothetical protein